MKWVLTPDEFTHVWANETQLDRRPYPINLAPAGTVRTESDHDALRLPRRFRRNADADLTAALTLCARTDATTITISGDRATHRVLAFAAVVHNHAGVLVAGSDTITVRGCHARKIGRHLVAAIGSAPAGRRAPLRELQEAVLHPDRTGGTGPDAAERFRRILRQPVDGRGFLTVTIAPEDPMSPPTAHRTWLDFTGDGRYLLATGHDLVLTPVTDADFAAELLRLARIR